MKPPRYRFLPMHRGTAWILCIVAAILLWANLRDWDRRVVTTIPHPRYDGEYRYYEKGWPQTAAYVNGYYELDRQTGKIRLEREFHFERDGILCDVLFAYALVILTWYTCEGSRMDLHGSKPSIVISYRPRLRLRLSTAILLMFTAGCIIWVHSESMRSADGAIYWPVAGYWKYIREKGHRHWPFGVDSYDYIALGLNLAMGIVLLTHVWLLNERLIAYRKAKHNYKNILKNKKIPPIGGIQSVEA